MRYRVAGRRKSATAWVDVQRHPDAREAIEAVLGPLDRFELMEAPSPAGESEPAVTPEEPQTPPPPEPDPWLGWPGPDPDELRRQPRLVADNPPPEPPELSDAELLRLLPPKWASATAVGWEIKAHDVLRARGVEWFRAQRLVREQSAAHDWRPRGRTPADAMVH